MMGDYGYCPVCGAHGVSRERRPNGNDVCVNGHTYPSSSEKDAPCSTYSASDSFVGRTLSKFADVTLANQAKVEMELQCGRLSIRVQMKNGESRVFHDGFEYPLDFPAILDAGLKSLIAFMENQC